MKMMRTKYFCVKCCTRVDLPVDHRKPRSLGGSDNKGNIQPMCDECHTWKHRNPAEAKEHGFMLGREDQERPWWKDFPYACIGK